MYQARAHTRINTHTHTHTHTHTRWYTHIYICICIKHEWSAYTRKNIGMDNTNVHFIHESQVTFIWKKKRKKNRCTCARAHRERKKKDEKKKGKDTSKRQFYTGCNNGNARRPGTCVKKKTCMILCIHNIAYKVYYK